MAASNDSFVFENPETGEEIFRCKARQGALNRAKLYLFKGADPVGTYQTNLWLALWGFLSAKAAGNDLVNLPAPRQITQECVLDLMDKVTVYYNVDVEDATEGGSDNENPTELSGESL